MSTAPHAPALIHSDAPVLLIGGGLASHSAATALRRLGHSGSIVLVSDESHLPYDRPPLSKDLLLGTADAASTVLLSVDKAAELDVELVLGDAVAELDPDGGKARLASGRVVAFERAVIATGSRARALPVPGADLDGVVTLRTLEDAAFCAERLGRGVGVVVVGGGFVGLEVAAAARSRGCEVTVVEQAPSLLARVLPVPAAEAVAEHHRASGITLLCGAQVAEVVDAPDAPGQVAGVVLADGTTVPAGLVVVGIGAIPNDELAESAGLSTAPAPLRGVVVDDAGGTSHPHVLAAGDVSSVRRSDGSFTRTEQWQDAQVEGTAVAHAILGLPLPDRPVDWFWSDQGDLRIQVAGDVLGVDGRRSGVVERSDESGGRTWFRHADDMTLLGAVTLGRVPDVRAAITLMEAGIPAPAEVLVDAGVDLRKWARAALKEKAAG